MAEAIRVDKTFKMGSQNLENKVNTHLLFVNISSWFLNAVPLPILREYSLHRLPWCLFRTTLAGIGKAALAGHEYYARHTM